MPHDKKGRLVEVGDFVKVKPYNTPLAIVGRVSFVNPDTDTCNARVAFPVLPLNERFIKANAGALSVEFIPGKEDYTQCSDMELVLKADGSDPAVVEAPAQQGPAGGPGTVGWMGGEQER